MRADRGTRRRARRRRSASEPAHRRWPRAVVALIALVGVAPVALVGVVDPPRTAFMLAAALDASRAGHDEFVIDYRWRDLEAISPWAALAVVAAEDQKFPQHHGFDVAAIGDALQARRDGGRLRGASTITQQLAKNLFLWSGRSWLRKGLEAWYTLVLELALSKRRILELYLNVAEFGPGVYGVQAAARRYFGVDAGGLDAARAALLATVLPAPRQRRVQAPDAAMRARQRWILEQMRQLGGPAWLEPVPR